MVCAALEHVVEDEISALRDVRGGLVQCLEQLACNGTPFLIVL